MNALRTGKCLPEGENLGDIKRGEISCICCEKAGQASRRVVLVRRCLCAQGCAQLTAEVS